MTRRLWSADGSLTPPPFDGHHLTIPKTHTRLPLHTHRPASAAQKLTDSIQLALTACIIYNIILDFPALAQSWLPPPLASSVTRSASSRCASPSTDA